MMLSIGYDSGKHVLCYQTESLKDEYDQLEEKYKALHLEYKEKSRMLDFVRRDLSKINQEKVLLQCSLLHKQKILKDFSLTHQAISELRQSRSQMSEDNALSESQLLSIKVPDPPTTIDLNALSNEKSNVISVLENLPGNDLREKIDLLRRSHAELKDELNRLKQNLQMNREKGNTIRRKLEDKLHIKLDHSENTLKQLHQAETNTTFGDSKLFELRFQLRQANVLQQTLTTKAQRMERQVEAYKQNELESDQRLDRLRIDKKKLLRELRDARNRIEELQADSLRNQKLIERLKENRLIEMKNQRAMNKSEEDEDDRVSCDDFTDTSNDHNSHSQ